MNERQDGLLAKGESAKSKKGFFQDINPKLRLGLISALIAIVLIAVLSAVAAKFVVDHTTLTLSSYQPITELAKATNKVVIQEKLIFIHRLAVNDIINEYIERGKADQVYSFYTQITGDKKITLLILSAALSQGIPVNLFFATAKKESEFNPLAIDGANRDGSKDYGLYQLNGNTFSQYAVSYLMVSENNVRLAAVYLRTLYDKYGSWDKALLAYNGGTVDGVSEKVIQYLTDTLHIETAYDQQFVAAF